MATKAKETIPADKWKWSGMPGHLIVSDSCVYHLCTVVGRHIISTVGEYRPRSDRGCGRVTIGCDRFFETMVFKAGKNKCSCGCGVPEIDGSEIDFLPANDAVTADKNHMKLCRKFAYR